MTTDKITDKPSDFTEGSVVGSILKMGLPSMFGFVAHQVNAMTDMFWVSRLPQSENAVAAITFFANLLLTLFAFNTLIGPGSLAIISRRYGEKAYEHTEKAIKETMVLKLFFGLVFGVIGWVFLPEFLYFLGANGLSLDLGISYGRIFLIGLPIMYATYSIFTAMRSVSNPKWAMNLMFLVSGLNIVLDPFLIFGYWGFPELGIKGAAYGSVISFTIVFLIGIIVFSTNRLNLRLRYFGGLKVSTSDMWSILKIGIPVSIGDLSFNTARLVITPIIASFGITVVAAYGVAVQLYTFGLMILMGIGLGLSSLIGHNIGVGKLTRAKETGDKAIKLGAFLLSLLGVLMYFLPEYYFELFFDSPETISYGVTILKIWALATPAFGALIMLMQIHVGAGLNTPYMKISFLQAWIIQVTAAVIAVYVFNLNQNALWWIMTIAAYICTGIFYLFYRKGQWLKHKL